MLDAFGDKIKARHVAVSKPGRGLGAGDRRADRDRYACGGRIAHAKEVARAVGYPVVVKAVGGGGGIGMQVGQEEAGIERALQSCSDRGKASFADARVYLERYVSQPRHIEVQVFCDTQGNGYALGERECSVQRRHQKIVEESPSPAAFFAGPRPEGAQRARRSVRSPRLRVVKKVGGTWGPGRASSSPTPTGTSTSSR